MKAKKMNKTVNKSAPAQTLSEVAPSDGVTGTLPAASPASPEPVKVSAFAARASDNALQMEKKMRLKSEVKQRLAEAFDAQEQGKELSRDVAAIAALQSSKLYSALTTGLLTNPEVKALLGEVFKYVAKSDGSDGATLAGEGNAILKRLNRAALAYERVNGGTDEKGGDGGKYLNPVPPEALADIVAKMDDGSLSVYSAYKPIADIRSDFLERRESAFSVNAIEAITEALESAAAIEKFANNGPLIDAYNGMIAAYNFLGEAIANLPEAETEIE